MNQLNQIPLAETLFIKRPKVMKRRFLYFIACLSLLSLNAWLINLAQAQDDSEIIEADSSYFADDATAPAPIMYDDEGNMINNNYAGVSDTLNQAEPMNNSLAPLDEEEEAMEMPPTANSDQDVISGSAPIYNQN